MSLDERLTIEVGPEEAGLSVLAVLGERLVDVATADIKRLIRGGAVTVEGRACGVSTGVQAGERVEALYVDTLPRIEPRRLRGFVVLHEEQDLLACHKPAGVPVEGERGDDERAFRAAVLEHLRQGGGPPRRPRVVHRLDRDTSGVVLVALTRAGLRSLTAQFESRAVEKEYLALVRGRVLAERGEVDLPLGLEPGARGRVSVTEAGKPARTRFEVAERFGRFTCLRVFPETGRQHQIRVHLASMGHPLAVDPTYGGAERLLLSELKRGYRPSARRGAERPLLDRLALHAARLRFSSPASGQPVEVRSPLPADLELALKQLRKLDPQAARDDCR